MLSGKILKIKWTGDFEVTIDRITRVFDDKDKMHDWFSRIVSQSKDARKCALLKADLRYMHN